MTTAEPQHTPAGGLGRAWRGFRRWQRNRPFWGGLLTALAGVEMFASTKMTIDGLSFSSGPTGLYSLLIPAILLTCGLLLWLSPAQRLFYSIVAAITTIYSLMGLNLGGFFVGLLLGLVGSALGFAWTPGRPAATGSAEGQAGTGSAEGHTPIGSAAGEPAGSEPGGEPYAGERSLLDDLMPADTGATPRSPDGLPYTGTGEPVATPARVPAVPRDAAPAGRGATPAEPSGGAPDPGRFAVALVVLGLVVGGPVAVRPSSVQAASTVPTPSASACAKPGRAATTSASPRRGAPPTTPTASPSPSGSPGSTGDTTDPISDFLTRVGDFFTGGRNRTEPTASPSAGPTPSTTPAATPGVAPSRRAAGCAPAKRDRPGKVAPGKLMPRIAPDPDQPKVAVRPSTLTGSKVTMTGLRFEGIVDLPTDSGSLKALKFSMAEAVTDDFKLVADGPAGRAQQYVTDRLTVRGDVAFYAARFSGKLLGIPVTLTPDLPFPDGIPITSPIPISFTDPVMELAFVDCDTLTAVPALRLSVP
ncbi:DUF6114 domain-containing protein [Micromonospora sp. KC723]|uniref:DUF6114 domain-containing protein n=1 Tax=Micromonospora sp. KC723 TaxID=2530381 RepID=UPI00104EA7C4|nr:DUF6114 domain-containing protein [Micromonospora sp. KC723]TDB73430.1 hypothetical protein E1165_17285 [Micromonospora sp. KC723]